MEGLFDYSLWGLFLASFLEATALPFSSEALLTFLIIIGLGILRANVWITAIAMLAGKFLRYLIWGWVTGLVF
jgi:membrane protein YqaA with SNARE-associated domain